MLICRFIIFACVVCFLSGPGSETQDVPRNRRTRWKEAIRDLAGLLVGMVNPTATAMYMQCITPFEPNGNKGNPFYQNLLRLSSEHRDMALSSKDTALRHVASTYEWNERKN